MHWGPHNGHFDNSHSPFPAACNESVNHFSQLSVHFFLPLLCHGPSIISQWDGQGTGVISGTLTAMSGALAKPFKHCLFINGCLRAGRRRRGRVMERSEESERERERRKGKNTIVCKLGTSSQASCCAHIWICWGHAGMLSDSLKSTSTGSLGMLCY